jgi:hypothetical protein
VDAGVPRGEVGGEEDRGEQDQQPERAARPMDRLADDSGDDEQEREREGEAPEAGGDRADVAQADEPRAEGERRGTDQERGEGEGVGFGGGQRLGSVTRESIRGLSCCARLKGEADAGSSLS